MAVKKKLKSPRLSETPVSGGKKRKRKPYTPVKWVCVGADISLSTISLGGIALTKEGKIRTGTYSIRWEKGTDYFERMKTAAKAYDVLSELFIELRILPELENLYLAVEEAVPIGMLQRATKGQAKGTTGAWMKQQIQIQGSFVGGLLRWGYFNIYEIQANQWRKLVADDLKKYDSDFSTHPSKWNDPERIPFEVHCAAKDAGKFRARQWVELFHPKWDGHWADLINHGTLGLINRPEKSHAQATQSDDRYEALAMAEWMRRERKKK